MNNIPLTPPILIRTIAEYKWKDAITKLVLENRDNYIIDRNNVWLFIIERDKNNKSYAFQNTYKNNILISSLHKKLPFYDTLNN